LTLLAALKHKHSFGAASIRFQQFQTLNPVHLSHLASPLTGYEISRVGEETTLVVGEHHAVLGDFPDDYQWVDPYSREPFEEAMDVNGMNNNAIGRMPKGSPYDALVVARGKNDQYIDSIEGIAYANLTIVGSVLIGIFFEQILLII
jgi:hypothetical protein